MGALIATNQPAAVSNLVTQTTGLTISIPDPNDPVEIEYHKLTADDDAAQAEVDSWIRENGTPSLRKAAAKSPPSSTPASAPALRARQKSLHRFPRAPPRPRSAPTSPMAVFSPTYQDEDAANDEFEKARVRDPKNPAPWNQLANEFTHHGPVDKAFPYYEKAIELNSNEPIYYQNPQQP